MYIEPNGTIKLLKNVPLDEKYRNTLWFEDSTAQMNYFNSLSTSALTFENQYYTRVDRGRVRIMKPIKFVYECNYMMFKNLDLTPPNRTNNYYENKWYYAFITGVNMINNEVTEVEFQIDVMQTWLFNYNFERCFIERQHTVTDVAGDNIVSENLEVGGYFDGEIIHSELFDYSNFIPVILSPYRIADNGDWMSEDKYSCGEYVTNNMSALNAYYVNNTNTSIGTLGFLKHILNSFAQNNAQDSIVAIYLVPRTFIPGLSSGIYNGKLPTGQYFKTVPYLTSKPTTLGSYEPTNKKLLTYPYSYFTLETFEGASTDYCYEFFDSVGVQFNIYANLTSNTSFKAVPLRYKGATVNFNETCIMSGLPFLAWASDSYTQWLAQNKSRIVVQGLQSLGGVNKSINEGWGNVLAGQQMLTPKTKQLSSKGATRVAKGYAQMADAIDSGGSSLLGYIGSTVSDLISHKAIPNYPRGSSDGSLELATNTKDFNFIPKYINPEYAKVIDDYFTMFGYAIKRIDIPLINARPHWTYIKTLGCTITPTTDNGLPSDAMGEIENLFDRGITFWKNPSEVGHYELDNSPT